MRKKVYGGLGLVALVLLGIFTIFKQKTQEKEKLATSLLPGERRKLVKKGNTITLIHKDQYGKETKKTIVNNRNFSVTEDYEGKLTIYAPTKGWALEPGLAFSASDRPRLGLDCTFFYWKNFGLGANVMSDDNFSIRFGLVGMYTIYSNTSVFLGIDHKKEGMIGVRVRL